MNSSRSFAVANVEGEISSTTPRGMVCDDAHVTLFRDNRDLVTIRCRQNSETRERHRRPLWLRASGLESGLADGLEASTSTPAL
jgi:hypothetical protein